MNTRSHLINRGHFWKPRFEAISRREERCVPEARERGATHKPPPKMGSPRGAGRFRAATASLVAHVPRGARIAPRSLFRSKIAPPKVPPIYEMTSKEITLTPISEV